MREEDARRARRDGMPRVSVLHQPFQWSIDPSFDPFRTRERANKIAMILLRSIRDGSYVPYNPVTFDVPKHDGSMRAVSVFPVAETTLATRTFRSLVAKNAVLMSANSFAYRTDRTPHDAVQKMSNAFLTSRRLYVAEFDFSKFFDTLDHAALFEAGERHHILWTELERRLIRQFLSTSLQHASSYARLGGVPRTVGIPQGNSISLFMANLAAMDMDQAIESTGVGYVRYADDTVMWSDSYSQLAEAVQKLQSNAQQVGAQINFLKSPGIRIFKPHGARVEFKSTKRIEFIGYSFSRTAVSMRSSTEDRIKTRLAQIVWTNLLSTIDPFVLQPRRIAGGLDRDYYTMILQLRRYIYGGMTETRLRKLLSGRALRIMFPGVMSYFPLVSDDEQLKGLDGWLLFQIERALKIRADAIARAGFPVPATPFSKTRKQLLSLRGKSSSGKPLDMRIPSFVRIGSAIYRASQIHGASAVARSAKGAQYIYGIE
jgi:hypothetical protein